MSDEYNEDWIHTPRNTVRTPEKQQRELIMKTRDPGQRETLRIVSDEDAPLVVRQERVTVKTQALKEVIHKSIPPAARQAGENGESTVVLHNVKKIKVESAEPDKGDITGEIVG